MLFFDRNNLIEQHDLSKQERELTYKRNYYKKKIQEVKSDQQQLLYNPKILEKFARENYLMKKDDEDMILIKSKEI